MASKGRTCLQFHLVLLLIERCNSTEEGAPHGQTVNRTGISKHLMLLRNSELATFGFNFLTILPSHALTINTELELAGYLLWVGIRIKRLVWRRLLVFYSGCKGNSAL